MIKKQKTMKFFRFRGGWFADVKGKGLCANQMVAGADLFLEAISKTKPIILADIRTTWVHHAQYKFVLTNHDANGGTYNVYQLKRDKAIFLGTAWLCNVTHLAMGEHAKRFYIKSFQLKDLDSREAKRLSYRYKQNITKENSASDWKNPMVKIINNHIDNQSEVVV